MDLTEKEITKAEMFSYYCGNSDKKFIKSLLKEKTSNINGFGLLKTFRDCEKIYLRPLCSAVSHGNYQIAKLLLKLGADPNIVETSIYNSKFTIVSPLYLAIAKNDIRMVKLLINFNADCDQGIFFEKSCMEGNLEIIKFLLPRTSEEDYISGLGYAVKNGHMDVVDYFFEIFGKDDETFCQNEYIFLTASHQACYTGKSEIIRIFITRMDENKIISYGDFFHEFFIGAMANDIDFDTIMLIFVKCNPYYVDKDDIDFIRHAFCFRRFDVLKFLLEFCDLKAVPHNESLLEFIEANTEDDHETNFEDPDFIESFKIIRNHCKND